jgi:hypothetical protein
VAPFTPRESDLDWLQLLGPLKAHQDDAPVPFWTNFDNVALADARGIPRLHGENHLTAAIDRRIHNQSIRGANPLVKRFPPLRGRKGKTVKALQSAAKAEGILAEEPRPMGWSRDELATRGKSGPAKMALRPS